MKVEVERLGALGGGPLESILGSAVRGRWPKLLIEFLVVDRIVLRTGSSNHLMTSLEMDHESDSDEELSIESLDRAPIRIGCRAPRSRKVAAAAIRPRMTMKAATNKSELDRKPYIAFSFAGKIAAASMQKGHQQGREL